MKKILMLLILLVAASSHYAVSDDTTSEIQKRLNEQVLQKPFSVADEATLNSNLNAATERGKPTHIATPVQNYGYYGGYTNPFYNSYYGYGYGYGLSSYRPYYYNYRPYYGSYWW